MSDEAGIYLDASALVKLVVGEAESTALASCVDEVPWIASSALVRTELPRAVRSHGPRSVARAVVSLDDVDLVPLDDELLDEAGGLGPIVLRSLDAIHLASALTLSSELRALVTYDQRMATAARELGFRVEAPA